MRKILYVAIFDDFSNKTLTGYFVNNNLISALNEAKESWAVSLDCNPEDIQVVETREVSEEEYQSKVGKLFFPKEHTIKTFHYEIGDDDKTNTAPITWPSVEAPTMRDAIDVILQTESKKRPIPLPVTVFLYGSTCIKHSNGAPAVVHGFTVTQA